MSANSQDQAAFRRNLRIYGRDLTNGRSGKTIRGLLDRAGEIVLNTQVAADPRGMAVMEVEFNAPPIRDTDELSDRLSGEKWRVVEQQFSCPVYARKYVLAQVVQSLDR